MMIEVSSEVLTRAFLVTTGAGLATVIGGVLLAPRHCLSKRQVLGLMVIIPIRMIVEEEIAPAVIEQTEAGRGTAPALQARALTFAR